MGAALAGHLIFAALLFGGWELAVRFALVDASLLPPLPQVCAILWGLLHDGAFIGDLELTATEVAVAFLIAAPLAISSGFLLGERLHLAATFNPVVHLVLAVPQSIFLPVFILAFGIGDASKIVTSWIVVVFLVFFNTFEGARSVDRDQINAARLLGASRWQITRSVIIPSTMSWFFAALTPALSFSLIGVIVGEFIGAEHGLGRVIVEAEGRGDSTDMMLAMIVLMIVGIVLAAVVRRVQDYLLRWQPRFH